jgi:hypothetical protein
MGKVFMSTLTLDGAATAARTAIERSKADAVRVAALALLSPSDRDEVERAEHYSRGSV